MNFINFAECKPKKKKPKAKPVLGWAYKNSNGVINAPVLFRRSALFYRVLQAGGKIVRVKIEEVE